MHYGSCAPLSTLRLQPHDCNPKTRYQLPAKLCWVMDLHHGYTMYAELAHPDPDPDYASREALIKSLFAFILEFLCNARNGLTRIASYLRKPMTKQCIKILIKENSMN